MLHWRREMGATICYMRVLRRRLITHKSARGEWCADSDAEWRISSGVKNLKSFVSLLYYIV